MTRIRQTPPSVLLVVILAMHGTNFGNSFPMFPVPCLKISTPIATAKDPGRRLSAPTFQFPKILLLTFGLWFSFSETSAAQIWQFENGQVELATPFSMAGHSLRSPYLLGSGGGGAVFAVDSEKQQYALKISWVNSAKSVHNECQVLRTLQERQVSGVERCVEEDAYPQDKRRTMLLLEPVFDNDASSVLEVPESLRTKSVRSIVRTLVQMLAARVVTTDVQPLISGKTGDVLFIDMTEAKFLESKPTLTDFSLASSFVAEMLSLIPNDMSAEASGALIWELKGFGSSLDKPATDLLELLYRQGSSIFSEEALESIERIIGDRGIVGL